MLYVIYGEERYLMNQKLEELKKKYPVEQEELNFTKLDCKEVPFSKIKEEISSIPFFSDYRFTLLMNPFFLTTEKVKKIKDYAVEEKDVFDLVQCLLRTTKQNIVVLFQEGKLDERKKIVKEIRKNATVFESKKLDKQRLKDTVANAFKKRNVEISKEAISLLMERTGDSLIEITKEIEKLALYSCHIDVTDVEHLVSKPLEENAFELSNALLCKNFNKVFDIYHDLKLQKIEYISLVGMLASSLRLLYQVKLLDRKGYQDREIADYLGINPYRLKYVRMNDQSFELNDLLSLLDQLSDLDVKMKTGKVEQDEGFEIFLVRMMA